MSATRSWSPSPSRNVRSSSASVACPRTRAQRSRPSNCSPSSSLAKSTIRSCRRPWRSGTCRPAAAPHPSSPLAALHPVRPPSPGDPVVAAAAVDLSSPDPPRTVSSPPPPLSPVVAGVALEHVGGPVADQPVAALTPERRLDPGAEGDRHVLVVAELREPRPAEVELHRLRPRARVERVVAARVPDRVDRVVPGPAVGGVAAGVAVVRAPAVLQREDVVEHHRVAVPAGVGVGVVGHNRVFVVVHWLSGRVVSPAKGCFSPSAWPISCRIVLGRLATQRRCRRPHAVIVGPGLRRRIDDTGSRRCLTCDPSRHLAEVQVGVACSRRLDEADIEKVSICSSASADRPLLGLARGGPSGKVAPQVAGLARCELVGELPCRVGGPVDRVLDQREVILHRVEKSWPC